MTFSYKMSKSCVPSYSFEHKSCHSIILSSLMFQNIFHGIIPFAKMSFILFSATYFTVVSKHKHKIMDTLYLNDGPTLLTVSFFIQCVCYIHILFLITSLFLILSLLMTPVTSLKHLILHTSIFISRFGTF